MVHRYRLDLSTRSEDGKGSIDRRLKSNELDLVRGDTGWDLSTNRNIQSGEVQLVRKERYRRDCTIECRGINEYSYKHAMCLKGD